ncbi:MAG: nitronate monooxygenase [Ginsengibacter sp.]
MENRIVKLLEIEIPIVQAGMVWTSGWRLASAVSNAGGLGVIGAGSMSAELLKEHIIKCKMETSRPFAVNLPLLYSGVGKQIDIIIEQKVPIVFTSAGNPMTWTSILKSNSIKVVHVVSSSAFAKKAEQAGCDAVVAEGFEAGGHNGREETTTMVLIPLVRQAVGIPVIAAGGIATGRQMMAAMVLGADGVQIGSRFVASNEASCHQNFKQFITDSNEGDTVLTLKEITPVRLMKNYFYKAVSEAYSNHASVDTLQKLLGHGRAKAGMFEGDLNEGELEIGQVSAMINKIMPAEEIIDEIWSEFKSIKLPL